LSSTNYSPEKKKKKKKKRRWRFRYTLYGGGEASIVITYTVDGYVYRFENVWAIRV
jgi:hypothetical protein